MALPYQELHYASTEQSLLTGADGFGVRTHSRGLPVELVERLKSRNVFLYESGSKPLAGIFELLQDPSLVEHYPKSLSFFREVVKEQVYYVFTRTVFIGRDYGWYLEPRDDSARSGNLFCHAIFILEEDFCKSYPSSVLQALLPQFKPLSLTNTSNNLELQQLLTNRQEVPQLLPQNNCTACLKISEPALLDQIEESILAIYSALESNRKVIIIQANECTERHLITMLSCLPRFIGRSLSFVSNYHDFNLFTDYSVLFLNEYYQRQIPKDHPNLILCDFKSGDFPSLPQSDFTKHLRSLFTSGNLQELERLINGFDEILEEFREGVSFNHVFYAWIHLLEIQSYPFNYNLEEVIRQIKDYPLKPEFRSLLETNLIDSFVRALLNKEHKKVAISLNLLMDLQLSVRGRNSVKAQFSDYFLADDNASQLHKFCQNQNLIFAFLELENREDHLFHFVSKNSFPGEVMAFYMMKFCELLPMEHVESLLNIAAIDGKITPDFAAYLEKNWGKDRFQKFLIRHDFFIYLGEKLQPTIFGADTRAYLRLLSTKPEGPFHFLSSKINTADFFQQYFLDLIELIPEDETPYQFNLTMLQFYAELVNKGYQELGNGNVLQKIILPLLQGFRWVEHDSLLKDLHSSLRKMAEVIVKMEEDNERFPPKSKQKTSISVLRAWLRLVLNTIELRNDYRELIKLQFSGSGKPAFLKAFIRFTLEILPITPWLDDDATKQLFLKLYLDPDIKELQLPLLDTSFKILVFIPVHQQTKLLRGKKTDHSSLIDFHCTYFQMIWSLRQQKKGDHENPEKIPLHQVKEAMVTALKYLLEGNRSACHEVLEFIYDEMEDRDTDLSEYIQKHVQTGRSISGILKRISSAFKKKNQ